MAEALGKLPSEVLEEDMEWIELYLFVKDKEAERAKKIIDQNKVKEKARQNGFKY